jgi:riboflavin synthase
VFTGIIEDLGTVAAIKRSPAGAVLTIRTALPLARVTLGESIAINGACMTVTAKGRGTFAMDISAERCLTLDKLIGGHLVSGHVDGVGRLISIKPEGDSRLYTFEVPAAQARYLVEKGSVAIDGISLTLFGIRGRRFSVALIPHTLKLTTLGFKRPGDSINVESDMLVKYVERILGAIPAASASNGRKRTAAALKPRSAAGAIAAIGDAP